MARIIDKEKTVITGGAAGICREAAVRFYEENAEVFVIDTDGRGLRELETSFPGMRCFEASVTDEEKINSIFDEIGDINILINGAGIQAESSYESTDTELSRKIWDVIYTGTLICTKAALRHMAEGTILDVLTHSGIRTNQYPYAAAKAGLRADIRNLAYYLSGKSDSPVSVNGISFAAVSGTLRNMHWADDEKAIADIKARTPLHRIITAEEAGGLIFLYIKYFSQYSTGSVFDADCGRSLC